MIKNRMKEKDIINDNTFGNRLKGIDPLARFKQTNPIHMLRFKQLNNSVDLDVLGYKVDRNGKPHKTQDDLINLETDKK